MLYRLFFSLVLRRVDAEDAHRATIRLLRVVAAVPGLPRLLGRVLGPPDPILRSDVLGLDIPAPLGMAAGFDKDARVHAALAGFGFGFVEVGTVTGQPQEGNPRPRMFRLPADRALVNRMGFNNEGAEQTRDRLSGSHRRRRHVVGINIGKTKAVPAEEAVEDYVFSTRRLAPLADYLVVNVSSPNTPGLRDLQAIGSLRPLLTAVLDAASAELPVLVKIAPDLADDDVDAVADLALELGLAGIIATNTTLSRDGLVTTDAVTAERGGLSGAPQKARSQEVLRRLRARVGDRLVLIAVGGIETPEDAYARIRAGASLVQAYTGLVYGGPLWPRRMHRGLAALLRADGFETLAEAVGVDA